MSQPKILVGFAYDVPSRAALSEAIQIARASGGELIVFHAFEPEPVSRVAGAALPLDPESEKRLLACDVSYARGLGVPTRLITSTDPMPDALFEVVQRENPDLIVVGTHDRRGLDRLFLGSVARSLLRASPRPVLVVRPPRGAEVDPLRLEKIIVGIDFRAASLRALEDAVWLAKISGARISLHHVILPGTRVEQDPLRRPSRRLEEMAEEVRRRGVECEAQVSIGEPSSFLVGQSGNRANVVIAVGTHNRSRASRIAFGGFAEAVLERARCPVLIAHPWEPVIGTRVDTHA